MTRAGATRAEALLPRPGAAAGLLILLVLAGHGASLGFGFVMDDWPQIVDSPERGRLALTAIFTEGVWASAGRTAGAVDTYRPLFTLWIEGLTRLFGRDPLGFHAGNLLLHGLNTLLVWRLAGRGLAAGPALFAAAVFAVHPVQVQAVSWISGATDLLMGALVLSAVLAFLRWRDSGRAPWLAIVLLAYAAAVLAKETALPLPLVLFGLDRWLRLPLRRSRPLAVLLLVPLVWALVRAAVIGHGAEAGLSFSAPGLRSVGDAVAMSVEATLFPLPQFYHFTTPSVPMASWSAVVAVIAWAAAARWIGGRAAALPILWFWAFLVLPLLAPLHAQSAWAFRFLYLPIVGVALLAGWLLGRSGWRLAATAAVLAGVALTVHAAADWRDDQGFYRLVIASDPAGASGYTGLARHYRRSGDDAAEEAVLQEAIRRVVDQRHRASAIEDYGIFLGQRGRHPESLALFQALAALPAHRLAGLIGIGNNQWALGNLPAALEAFEEAVRLAPTNRQARASRDAIRRLRISAPG